MIKRLLQKALIPGAILIISIAIFIICCTILKWINVVGYEQIEISLLLIITVLIASACIGFIVYAITSIVEKIDDAIRNRKS